MKIIPLLIVVISLAFAIMGDYLITIILMHVLLGWKIVEDGLEKEVNSEKIKVEVKE